MLTLPCPNVEKLLESPLSSPLSLSLSRDSQVSVPSLEMQSSGFWAINPQFVA